MEQWLIVRMDHLMKMIILYLLTIDSLKYNVFYES